MRSRLSDRFGRSWQFADRPDEGDEYAPALRLRDLLSLAEPCGGINRAIRTAQIAVLIRMVPEILASQLIAGLIVVAALADSVPLRWTMPWCAALAILCVWRGFRACRLRVDPAYAERSPPT